MERLLQARQGLYERGIAGIMATVSSWSYSDVTTFAEVMSRTGFGGGNAVSVNLQNDALLVGTTAFLLQSKDRRVVVLSFRGTEPRSLINWLANINAKVEPFHALGYVHGGFYRPLLALWHTLMPLLEDAMSGVPLCDMGERTMHKYDCHPPSPGTPTHVGIPGPGGGGPPGAVGEPAEPAPRVPGKPDPGGEERGAPALRFSKGGAGGPGGAPAGGDADEPVLFITGHSLGGALATLAATRIYAESSLHEKYWKRLRGIYTFGQPMVGTQEFAKRFEGVLGQMLYRHIYKNDVVPRMPPRTAGDFRHIGEEYRSTDEGWAYQSELVSQARSFVGSTLTGIMAFVLDQLAGLPVLERITFPYSWEAHAPVHYLRVSQMAHPAVAVL
ncbi:lipase family protein [Sorangium sp. So ce854]|uniref:lipase family protein n=1 Tax=Sorangium sp. So ce854 TaxID=3133322 RepID=UPI003F5F1A95